VKQEFVYTFSNRVEEIGDGTYQMGWSPNTDPFQSEHALEYNEALNTVQRYPSALSADECDAIIDYGENLPRSKGRVELGGDQYRVSHIAWLEHTPEMEWLYHKLGGLFLRASHHYGFALTGFVDALQYTVYGPEQHFAWHMDLGPGRTSTRKLSMTIQLSENTEFTGGELQIIGAPTGSDMGMATFFPSFMAHRVSPVVTGTRRSLVAWGCGPAFR